MKMSSRGVRVDAVFSVAYGAGDEMRVSTLRSVLSERRRWAAEESDSGCMPSSVLQMVAALAMEVRIILVRHCGWLRRQGRKSIKRSRAVFLLSELQSVSR